MSWNEHEKKLLFVSVKCSEGSTVFLSLRLRICQKSQFFQEFVRQRFFSFVAAQRSVQQQTGGHPSQSLRPTRGFAPTVSSVCTSALRFSLGGDADFLDSRHKAVANMATNGEGLFFFF